MARMAVRVSGGSVCQASITLANSSVIVPLPVSGANRCANRFSRGPFSSGSRGFGSGLQIRHPGIPCCTRVGTVPRRGETGAPFWPLPQVSVPHLMVQRSIFRSINGKRIRDHGGVAAIPTFELLDQCRIYFSPGPPDCSAPTFFGIYCCAVSVWPCWSDQQNG